MKTTTSGLPATGVFANGVAASTVVQMIRDHDEAARLDDIAAYFGLEVDDVAAALEYCALHVRRLEAEGKLVR